MTSASTSVDPATRPSIMSRTARGAGWTIGWRLANRAIGFCSTLILVRLLTPADFGLVSLAFSFFQSLDRVAGFGVEGAIIRAERDDRAIYDAGFTINVVRGLFTVAVLLATAKPLAEFFGNAHLANVIIVLAFGWAVSAFQNIGVVQYRRDLAFEMEFRLQIIPRLLALAVAIPSAIIWQSYWALVAGIVATRVITVTLSYLMHPYRPRFGLAGMKYIFGFSFWEWLIGLMSMIGGRADTVVIGRLLGAASVGIYDMAGEISALPSSEIIAPLCRALFSGFVAEKREGGSGVASLLRIFGALSLLTFPMCAGISLVAYPIVKLGFGEEWLPAVPLIQISGIVAMVILFSSVAETLFSAHAWLKSLLSTSIFCSALRIALLLVTIPVFGIIGGTIAGSTIGIVQELVYLHFGIRKLRIRVVDLLARVLRPAIGVVIMMVVLNVLGLGWQPWHGSNGDLGLDLGLAIGIGAVTYGTTIAGLWLAAGRPNGPEADVLLALGQMLNRRRRA